MRHTVLDTLRVPPKMLARLFPCWSPASPSRDANGGKLLVRRGEEGLMTIGGGQILSIEVLEKVCDVGSWDVNHLIDDGDPG